jgi:hypothetical protein
MRNVSRELQGMDRKQLQLIANSVPAQPVGPQGNAEQVSVVFNDLFKQLRAMFPASMANIREQDDLNNFRQQWLLAFAENGIRTKAQVDAGLRIARQQERPFLPSPGQFVTWCQEGEGVAHGLPTSAELYDLVVTYNAKKYRYPSPEAFPWPSNACYWMVTRLSDRMRNLAMTDAELRKECVKSLRAMVKRIDAGMEIPVPVITIPELYTPASADTAKKFLESFKKMLGRSGS